MADTKQHHDSLGDDDDLPTAPLLRKAYSYGTVEDEERENAIEAYHRQVSFGAATDISDLSESVADLGELEKFDLLASTESVRRWIGRPVLLPSASDLGPLDPVRRRRSIEERLGPDRAALASGDVAAVEEAAAKAQRLNHRDRLTIAVLAIANLFSIIVFSCIAPFFPEEAKQKGASETAIGFVFGIFELVIVLVAPIFGRYLTQLGSKFTFGTGLCVTGVTSILFGFLRYSPPGATFIALCFVVRSVEAVADAAFVTASFAIASSSFPLRVATVIGVLETFTGLGYTVGPPLGGALYELGGFSLPFWVLGGVLLVAGFSCVYLIPKQRDSPRDPVGNIFGLMRSWRTCLMVLIIFVSNAGYSFLDPTLEPHLTSFHLTPVLIGLMFLLAGGVYAVAAPFWGYLTDRKEHWADAVMMFGSFCSFVAFLFIGPSPFFPFEKDLWIVGLTLVIMGLGVGAQMIPPFQQCLLEARNARHHSGMMPKQNYPDSFETYGLVSSLFQSAVSFGAFFGPTIGGIIVQNIGFAWSSTIFSLLNLLCVILLAIDMIHTKVIKTRREKAAKRTPVRRFSSCLR